MSSTLKRVAWLVLATACIRCGSAFTSDASATGSDPTGAGGASPDGSVGSSGSSAGASGSLAGGPGGSIGAAGGGTGGGGPGGSAGAGTGGSGGGGLTDAGLGGAAGGRDAASDGLVPPSLCPPAPPVPMSTCTKEGLGCTYGSALRPACRNAFKCVNMQWQSDLTFGTCPKSGVTCPGAPPVSASNPVTCDPNSVGLACDYATGEICSCADSICIAACMILNPPRYVCSTPPAHPCPAVIPNAGSGCTQTASCNYPGAACGIVAKCSPNTGVTSWTWTATSLCPR